MMVSPARPDDQIVVDLSDYERRHYGMEERSSGPDLTYRDSNPGQSAELFAAISAGAQATGGDLSGGERTEGPETRQRQGIVGHRQPDYFDGGYDITTIGQWAVVLGSSGALVAFLKTTGPALVQWIKNRGSRSVRVKCGDIEVSINGTDDVQRALDAVNALRPEPSESEPS